MTKICGVWERRNSPEMRIVVVDIGVKAIMILVLIATAYAIIDAIASTMILSKRHSLHPMIIHVVIIIVAWYGTTGVHVWTSLHLLRIHGCRMILIHFLLLHKNYILFFILTANRKVDSLGNSLNLQNENKIINKKERNFCIISWEIEEGKSW